MLKRIFVFCLIMFGLTGCTYEKGLILFNNQPINKQNILHDQKVFNSGGNGAKIYYIFLAPKKMNNDFIRVQIFKMTDKAALGGYDVVRTKDFRASDAKALYETEYQNLFEKYDKLKN